VASARRKAAGLPEPEAFVTAERVQNGKPEPDAYLLGAQLLELEPEECVVVEDAAAGILSGLAAGCHVVAVNAPVGSPRLEDVDMLLNSLEELVIHKNADGSIDVHRKH
jgi:sugar-phosphatase